MKLTVATGIIIIRLLSRLSSCLNSIYVYPGRIDDDTHGSRYNIGQAINMSMYGLNEQADSDFTKIQATGLVMHY